MDTDAMVTPPPLLDARDLAIVAAVATGSTQAEAGELAGCSARTIRRRLTEPPVRAALDAERTRLAHEVADALTGRSRAAVDRLAAIIEDGNDRDAVQAARALLDAMIRHRDHAFVNDRLDTIEASLERKRENRWPAATASNG
jgi:hypothetical protein